MGSLVMVLVVALGLGVVAWAVFGKAGRAQRSENSRAKGGVIPRIDGPGRFDVEVVGESHYRSNFEAVLGQLAYTEQEMVGDAMLRLDDANPHDPQAVGVWVQGRQLGHLSRTMARSFRQALQRDGFGQLREVAVGCRVYAGGAEGLFSVSVDLPQA